MIEVTRLIKRFGPKTVLRGLDFQVAQGEFVALLGPNGAGKSTFLRILASLSRANLGKVSIAGYSLPEHAAEVRRRLGVVTHLPLVYGELAPKKTCVFMAACTGWRLENASMRSSTRLDLPGGARPGADLFARHAAAPGNRAGCLHDPRSAPARRTAYWFRPGCQRNVGYRPARRFCARPHRGHHLA
jgi:hypothetical protein